MLREHSLMPLSLAKMCSTQFCSGPTSCISEGALAAHGLRGGCLQGPAERPEEDLFDALMRDMVRAFPGGPELLRGLSRLPGLEDGPFGGLAGEGAPLMFVARLFPTVQSEHSHWDGR